MLHVVGGKRGAYEVLVGRPEGKNHSEDGRIMLKNGSSRRGWRGMDWTDLAENRNSWRALVNAVMNLRVP
jgi:hypothetical protein